MDDEEKAHIETARDPLVMVMQNEKLSGRIRAAAAKATLNRAFGQAPDIEWDRPLISREHLEKLTDDELAQCVRLSRQLVEDLADEQGDE